MPSLGADMESGTLLEWLVKPGDVVHKGDIVAVIDTDKAAVEIECFDSGTIEEILVPEGQRVPVGTALAMIGTAESEPVAVPPEPETVPPSPPKPVAAPLAGPLVRKLAKELGVDLSKVRGTGRGNGITRADVRRAAEPPPAPKAAPPRDRRVTPYARRLAKELGVDLAALPMTDSPVRAADIREAAQVPAPEASTPTAPVAPASRAESMRQATATLMARSKREIPHYYLSSTVDMSAALAWLRDVNRDLPVERRVLPAAVLLAATARAVAKVPALNGFWVDDRFQPSTPVNLGVAVSIRGGGLVTPAIAEAASLSAIEMMDRLRDLVTRARGGRLRAGELTTATITVSNMGDLGVDEVFGVIFPPQVALVGFGKVLDRPWAVDGLLGVRPVVTVTLSADHRATDGHTGGRLLDIIGQLLNKPEEL